MNQRKGKRLSLLTPNPLSRAVQSPPCKRRARSHFADCEGRARVQVLDNDEDVTPCSRGADEDDREFLLESFISCPPSAGEDGGDNDPDKSPCSRFLLFLLFFLCSSLFFSGFSASLL
ncbi:unnamed protein product [Lathyrus oleraceus]